jgi:tRNA dimethylallyltransferase
MKNYPLIVLAGPTAVGKTDVAVELAQVIDAEIVSCDAMMVYKEPRIIVNKPSRRVLDRIPHHMIDVVSVTENYDVARFRQEAESVIRRRYASKNLILTGGSGLYIRALLDGLFEGPGADPHLRQSFFEREQLTPGSLFEELCRVDSVQAKRIGSGNLRRIIRALEIYRLSGKPMSVLQAQTRGLRCEYDIRFFVLNMEREVLYRRIDKRAAAMLEEGAFEEVRHLKELPLSATAMGIIGIRELVGYLDGVYGSDEALSILARKTRNYAKRQLTWFRHEKSVQILDRTHSDDAATARRILDSLA